MNSTDPDAVETAGPAKNFRVPLYLLVNVAFALAAAWGSATVDAPTGRVVYLILLFALCSVPIGLMRGFNDRYFLLGVFMATYFMYFGMLDFQALLMGGHFSSDESSLTAAEYGVILGAISVVAGCLIAASRSRTARGANPAKEWSRGTILFSGLLFYISGVSAYAYYHLVAVTTNSNLATARALDELGPIMTFVVMLGHLILPLGILILAYGYAKFRTSSWFALILVILVIQLLLGFLGDSKSVPLEAAVLVILARTVIDDRPPIGWLLLGTAVTLFAFPIFQAYRMEVVGERGLNRAQAVQNLGKVLEIAFASRNKVTQGPEEGRAQTLVERASIKGNLEVLFAHAGVDSPFLYGATLPELAYSFIPRFIWPGKPSVEVGELFNKAFISGDSDSYVSPSHLGELYWNFGWPGIVVGMFVIGTILGFVGVRSSLADHKSATRLLVLLATVEGACIGFQGSIAIPYVVWLRSLAAIGILHMLFSRPQQDAAVGPRKAEERRASSMEPSAGAKYPTVIL